MATSRIKLPDLINRWIEVQKKETDLERSKPLDIDAINLTLLLKSMGLRLQYLDFDAEKDNADNLTITVKCNRSGMKAQLSYDLLRCSCPEKTERESSFWEVQGTGPKVFSKFKNNTSSNLLPVVSESCALVSKAMLSNLLDFYETSIREVKEEKQIAMLRSPLKSPRPMVNVISPGMTIKGPLSTPPAEGKCSSRMETPGASQNGKEKNDTKEGSIWDGSKSLTSTDMQSEFKSNVSSESVGINNKTHELLNTDHHTNKPEVDTVFSPAQSSSVPDDYAYETMKTLVTSSPNQHPVSAVHQTADSQHDRDLNVINYLQQAFLQIDMAMLLMKSNTTQNALQGSALTVTPQNASTVSRKSLITPKFAQPRSNSLLSFERRHPPLEIGGKKKTPITSSLASTPRLSLGSAAGRVDTPRPTIAQVKTVAALRKPVSILGSGSPGGTQLGKPTTGMKKPPTGSISALSSQRKLLLAGTNTPSGKVLPKAPAPSRSTYGLVQRSSSASLINKK